MDITPRQRIIMKIRFIERVKDWKSIQVRLKDFKYNLEERTIFRDYKKVIDILING